MPTPAVEAQEVLKTEKPKPPAKRSAKKSPSLRKAPAPAGHGVCKTCSVLPVGSAELTSLLLVLIFSLVSVLFTAIMALNSQQQQIVVLEQHLKAAGK